MKDVGDQFKEEHNMRVEMATCFEECQRQMGDSQRTFEERLDKQFEEKMESFYVKMHAFMVSMINN